MTPARWRLLLWAALAFTFVMAVLPHPPRLPGQPSDKVQHVIAFTTLAILARIAHRQSPAVPILAGLSAFGAVIEVAQLYPPIHRDGDIVDWVADTLAVAAVLAAARLFHRP